MSFDPASVGDGKKLRQRFEACPAFFQAGIASPWIFRQKREHCVLVFDRQYWSSDWLFDAA